MNFHNVKFTGTNGTPGLQLTGCQEYDLSGENYLLSTGSGAGANGAFEMTDPTGFANALNGTFRTEVQGTTASCALMLDGSAGTSITGGDHLFASLNTSGVAGSAAICGNNAGSYLGEVNWTINSNAPYIFNDTGYISFDSHISVFDTTSGATLGPTGYIRSLQNGSKFTWFQKTKGQLQTAFSGLLVGDTTLCGSDGCASISPTLVSTASNGVTVEGSQIIWLEDAANTNAIGIEWPSTLSANYIFTLPAANSNPVVPSTCSGGTFADAISSGGVIACAAPLIRGIIVWSPTSISGGCAEQTVTVTGFDPGGVGGKAVLASPATSMGSHLWIGYAREVSANTVAVQFCGDATGGTPPSGYWLFTE